MPFATRNKGMTCCAIHHQKQKVKSPKTFEEGSFLACTYCKIHFDGMYIRSILTSHNDLPVPLLSSKPHTLDDVWKVQGGR